MALTIEDTDKIVDSLCNKVMSNPVVMVVLGSTSDYRTRWVGLELYINQHLESVGLDRTLFQTLWIRERFFLEMQKRTGDDYGFCEHFIPAYRAMTESCLTGNHTLDLWHKCTYGSSEPIPTTCSGTDRYSCVFLHPEAQQERDALIEYAKEQIIRSMSARDN